MSKKCSNISCGREIQDSAVFCPFCGTQQVDDANLTEEERLRKELAEKDEMLNMYREMLKNKNEQLALSNGEGDAASRVVVLPDVMDVNEPVHQIESEKADTTQSPISDRLQFDVNGVSFDMIRVEGGTFMMGATTEQGDDAYEDEYPTHKVTLNSYYICETQVTQTLGRTVMGVGRGYAKGDNMPIEMVSWDDAQAFIVKPNQ